MDFVDRTAAMILEWHGVAVPNDAARRIAADLESAIRGFEAVRDRLRFEDEPASFETALKECQE